MSQDLLASALTFAFGNAANAFIAIFGRLHRRYEEAFANGF
jgi:hypothetical protein